MAEDSSDSDYIVEDYVKPDRIAKKVQNDESADLLGNFLEQKKVVPEYGKFPEDVFKDDYDHDGEKEFLKDNTEELIEKKKAATKLKKKLYFENKKVARKRIKSKLIKNKLKQEETTNEEKDK